MTKPALAVVEDDGARRLHCSRESTLLVTIWLRFVLGYRTALVERASSCLAVAVLCAPIVAAAQPAGESGATDDAAKASEPAVVEPAKPTLAPVEKPAPDKSAPAA